MKVIVLVVFLMTGLVAKSQTGIASRYAKMFEGRKTATGEIFRHDSLTAASNYYKLGSLVKVISGEKSVIVRINDRMSKRYGDRRLVDLTIAAAKQLDFTGGLLKVKIERL